MSTDDKKSNVCPGACQNEIANGRACASGECVRATYEGLRKLASEFAIKVLIPRAPPLLPAWPSDQLIDGWNINPAGYELGEIFRRPTLYGMLPSDAFLPAQHNRFLTQEELEGLWSGLNDTVQEIDGAKYLTIQRGKHRRPLENPEGWSHALRVNVDMKLGTFTIKPIKDEK